MTTISALGASVTNLKSAASAKNQVDYETFLKLLVTQMKNQDPTKPMESTEYVAQLANFSNVEQAVKTNEKLDRLMEMSALTQAGSLVGRVITSADGSMTGTIDRVRIFDNNIVAVLTTGEELIVGTGVSISQ